MEGKKSTSKFAIIAGILFAILALWYLKDELQWMSSEYYSFDIWCWLYIIACAAFAVFLLLRKRGSYAVAPAALLVLAVLIYSVSDLSLPDLFEWLFSLEWFEYYYWFEYLMLLLLFLMRVLSFAGMLALCMANLTNAFSGQRKLLNSLWFAPAVLLAVQVVLYATVEAIIYDWFWINDKFLLMSLAFLSAGLWIAYPEGLPKKAAAAPVDNVEAATATEVATGMEAANTTETARTTSAAGAAAVTNEAYCGLVKHILLLLFTFGIWQFIWIYRMTRYTDGVEGEEPRTPTNQLLLCLFVPFYIVYWMYKTAQRVDKMAAAKGISSDLSILCLILQIFVAIVPPVLLQDKLNDIVTAGDARPAAVQPAAAQSSAKNANTLGTAEELKTYKELLDCGVITQEEFDAKKRQLLGL